MIVSCAKTAEPIEMPFRVLTWVGPRNHVLDGVGSPPPQKRGNLRASPSPFSASPEVTTSWRYKNTFIIIITIFLNFEIFDPSSQFPGNEKNARCNIKYTSIIIIIIIMIFKPTSTKQ